MIQQDIKSLLSNLVSTGTISNSFLDKFESIMKASQSKETKTNILYGSIIGIYFLYLFQSFSQKNKNLLVEIENKINTTVEKFNSNEISSNESREILDRLVIQKMQLETTIEHILDYANLLPFAEFKNTIEIDKMFNELNKLSLLDSEKLKELFIFYFNDFEKNKDSFKPFEKIDLFQANNFRDFLKQLVENLEQKTSILQ